MGPMNKKNINYMMEQGLCMNIMVFGRFPKEHSFPLREREWCSGLTRFQGVK
jgi:hypothetical protein